MTSTFQTPKSKRRTNRAQVRTKPAAAASRPRTRAGTSGPRAADGTIQTPHFLEYDPANVHNPDAPYAVLSAPYERTVSFGTGTANAPAAILNASKQIELFDEELRVAPCLRVQTLPDVDCRSGSEIQGLHAIREAARPIMARRRFLMTFGGEHTITAPLVEAARSVWGDSLSVLHLDAHLDLRDQFRGNRLSHACVMRRVMDLGVPIVHVGIRSLCEEEYRLVNDRGLNVFWAHDITRPGNESWVDLVSARLKRQVYITLDVDGLDPSVMPGTGTPEPGGLSWRAVIGLLRRVCSTHEVVAADVVETVPIPGTPLCEYTAARLATKLMTYHALNKKAPA